MAILALAAGGSQAKPGNGGGGKPGGGGNDPPVTGVLYVVNNGDFGDMAADGSAGPLPILFSFGTTSQKVEPSHEMHGDGDDAWFAGTVANGTNPDGSSRKDVYLVDLNGNNLLIAGPTVNGTDTLGSPGPIRWHDDGGKDGAVSWFGLEFDASGAATAGLYVALVAWDLDGMPIATPALKLIDVPAYQDLDTGMYYVGAYGHDWSPNGQSVVVSLQTSEGGPLDLYTWDAGNGLLPLAMDGFYPEWCPNAAVPRIAFESPAGLELINDDGTGRALLVNGNQGGKSTITDAENVHWSPDGNYLIYDWLTWNTKNGNITLDVFRVSAGGGGNTNLTQGYGLTSGVAWRNAP